MFRKVWNWCDCKKMLAAMVFSQVVAAGLYAFFFLHSKGYIK